MYNRVLNQAIRKAKRDYYQNMLTKYKHELKKTWRTLNTLLCRNKKNKAYPDRINTGAKIITNTQDIATYFNSFFSSIGPKLATSIRQTTAHDYKKYLTRIINCSFSFKETTPQNVTKIINNFLSKSSCGHDGLSMKLIKSLKAYLSRPLSLIINQSFCTGIFPDKLKIAKITPLFKKGDELIVDNYRPISVLPVLSKIFEKLAFAQLYDYFNENKLLYHSQYGFRKGHSTELASIEFIDNVIHKLDQGKLPISVFLDLSKAFDTLAHDILLHRLNFYGVHGIALNWFQSYINGRTQYVQIEDKMSTLLPISTGVPQGSILGPLLFIIYINDICSVSSHFYPILYADDTTLISTLCVFHSEANRASAAINTELWTIKVWLASNKLSLNTQKTKYMIFHSVNYPNNRLPDLALHIDNVPIEKVAYFDFLGLRVSDTLKWQDHTNKITNKISKSIGVMSRLKHVIKPSTLVTIYNSLVLPHLYFSILCWGFESERLVKLQKRAVRIIHRAKYNAHSEPLLKKSGLLALKDIFDFQCCKFYFKFKHNLLPDYFTNFFTLNNEIHNYNTRSIAGLHRFPVNKSRTDSCIRHYIPSLSNSLPPKLKTDSIHTPLLFFRMAINCLSSINTHRNAA